MSIDEDFVSPGDESAIDALQQAEYYEEQFHRWWHENIGLLPIALLKARGMIPINRDKDFVHGMYLRGLDGAREHASGLPTIPDGALIGEINAEARDLVIYLLELLRREKAAGRRLL